MAANITKTDKHYIPQRIYIKPLWNSLGGKKGAQTQSFIGNIENNRMYWTILCESNRQNPGKQ